MFKKLIGALIIGIIFTLFVIQDDPWIKQIVAQGFKYAFQTTGNCNIQFTVSKINLFSPCLELSHVIVTPVQSADWYWTSEKYVTKSSWWHLLLYGVIDMDITMSGFQAESRIIHGQCAIQSHIQDLLQAPAVYLPTQLKSVTFEDSSFVAVDQNHDIKLSLAWHSTTKKIDKAIQANISLLDGSAVMHNHTYLEHLVGDWHIEIYKNDQGESDFIFRGACSFQLPDLPDSTKTCYLTGFWEHDHGLWKIKHANHLLLIDPIKLNTIDQKIIASLHASMPAQFLWNMSPFSTSASIEGHVMVHILSNLSDFSQGAHGYILAKKLKYEARSICQKVRFSFSKAKDIWKGALDIMQSLHTDLHGSWQWNTAQKEATLQISNESMIDIPGTSYWQIHPGKAALHLQIHDNSILHGTYNTRIMHTRTTTEHIIEGHLKNSGNTLLLQGSYDTYPYTITVPLPGSDNACTIELADANENNLAHINWNYNNDNSFTSVIQLSWLRLLAQQYWGYYIQGTGNFMIEGSCTWPEATMQIHLAEGVIRLPETYNFLHDFSCKLRCNIPKKSLHLSDFICQFHKGTIRIPEATGIFHNYGSWSLVHIPFTIEHFLCNVQKDLFTQISGVGICQKNGLLEPALLKGHLFLDRGQLVENMLFERFISKVRARTESLIPSHMPVLNLQLSVETKEPLRIRTAFLETDATIQAQITDTLSQPSINGSVQFHAGRLLFPYRPLYITQGYIEFQKQKLLDPHIMLCAQNQIKSHTVSLQVTGSLHHNQISFNAVPFLAEEQILSLLLVGSTEESLNVVMPALVVQNISSLLFSSQKSPVKVARSLGKLLQPLQHIRLIPHFTDQTGRGGLRGAIEIDLSDRWRALIQKNFSLTEDTRFELSYDVSDDMSIHMYRDERRDIAAEIEMRWKW